MYMSLIGQVADQGPKMSVQGPIAIFTSSVLVLKFLSELEGN